MKDSIYFDYAAGTPLLASSLDKMMPFLTDQFANSESSHSVGKRAHFVLQEAREKLANFFGCVASEVYFTGSATESINLALIGYLKQRNFKGHVITTNSEHKAVLNVCRELEAQGVEVTYLNVNELGLITSQQVIDAIREDTCLISINWVNSLIGVSQPVQDIFTLVKQYNQQIICHSDVTQAVAFNNFDLKLLNADMISFNGSKCYGPKGIGVLIKRNEVVIKPLIFGGSQENGLRAGTHNLPAIVGLTNSIDWLRSNIQQNRDKLLSLSQLVFDWQEKINFKILGRTKGSISHVFGLFFPGVDQDVLLTKLDQEGFMVSAGSACDSRVSMRPDLVDFLVEKEKGAFLRVSVSFLSSFDDLDRLFVKIEKFSQSI